MRYVVITPVRDEEKYIAGTFECMRRQTVLPVQWIIVDDGSKDRTGEMIDRYAAQHPWISTLHRADRGFRKSGGGVVDAFQDGYRKLRSDDWDFIVKLDGDLAFADDYFESCLNRFENDPHLGIGGGDICHDVVGELKVERNPRFHVRGATKIYRRACWRAIGGLVAEPGWDTIDEVKANMLGWRTYSFPELSLLHHRLTGTAESLWRDLMKHGVACYTVGYHPAFFAASCFRRIVRKPYLMGAIAMLLGYLKACTAGKPRPNDLQLVRYVRKQQLRRLCGLETIWK